MDTSVEYLRLYDCIYSIFEQRGRLNKLLPINMKEDQFVIHKLVNTFINNNSEYRNWDDDKWIKSLYSFNLCVTSFLFKRNVTLGKIYEMADDSKRKDIVSIFRSLVVKTDMIETIEKAATCFVKEEIDLENIKTKQTDLLLNIGDYKNPKNLANIIDLLRFKRFRDSIVNNILSSAGKIGLLELIDESSKPNYEYISNILEKYCTAKNSTFIIDLIMNWKITGEVFMKNELYSRVKLYVNDLIKHSDVLNTYTRTINENYKKDDIRPAFKETVRLTPIDDSKNFIEIINENKNPFKFDFDFGKLIEKVTNGKTRKFTLQQFERRLMILVCAVVEKFSVIISLPVEEKVSYVNNLIKSQISNIEQSDIFSYTPRPDINKTNYAQEMKETVKNTLKIAIQDDKTLKELPKIREDFLLILKHLKDLDYETINSKDFNIFQNFIQRVIDNADQLKAVLIRFGNQDLLRSLLDTTLNYFNINMIEKTKEIVFNQWEVFINSLIQEEDIDISQIRNIGSKAGKIMDILVFNIMRLMNKKVETKKIVRKVNNVAR